VLIETILPRGVALVRVVTKQGKVVLVSSTLNPTQQLAARVAACILAINGSPFVLIEMRDMLAVLNDAA
jgi:hypothetical protein